MHTRARRPLVLLATLLLGSVVANPKATAQPDLTGDGVPEVLRPPEQLTLTADASVWIADGATGQRFRRLTQGDARTGFGWAAIWTGDVDGDGHADVAVAAPLAQPDRRAVGRVYVFSSGSGLLLHELAVDGAEQFALAVVPNIDLDGDDVEDLIVRSRIVLEDGNVEEFQRSFSMLTGTEFIPGDRKPVGTVQLASDVSMDGVVAGDDLLSVVEAIGSEGVEGTELLDVNTDGDVSVDDASLVASDLGESVDAVAAEPGMGLLYWDQSDPALATLSFGPSQRWYPPDGGGYPGPWDPDGPVDWNPLPWPDITPDTDQNDPDPNDGDPDGDDPDDTRGPCSPKISRKSKWICLASNLEALPPGDQYHEETLRLSGTTANLAHLWEVSGDGAWFFRSDETLAKSVIGTTAVLRVFKPGLVTVKVRQVGDFGPTPCATPGTRVFRVVRADVDMDSDNNDDFNPPHADGDEEREERVLDEDHPGKVVQVGNWDSDHDALPDRLDGFNLIATQPTDQHHVTIDDSSTHHLVPLLIKVRGPLNDFIITPVGRKDRPPVVRLEYSFSDPKLIGAGQQDPFAMPTAPDALIRLWTRDGTVARSAVSLIADPQGGGLVVVGQYYLRELESAYVAEAPPVEGADPIDEYRLWVEAVRPGLAHVSVSLDPDGVDPPLEGRADENWLGGPEGYMCPDVLDVTCTQLTLFGRPSQEVEPLEMLVMMSSALSPTEEETEDDDLGPFPYGSFMIHKLRVEDWRSQHFQSNGVLIGPMQLGLGPDQSDPLLHWTPVIETEEFLLAPSPGPSVFGPLEGPHWRVVRLDPGTVEVHWNPNQPIALLAELLARPAVRQMRVWVDAVEQAIEQGTIPVNLNQRGGYGAAVHQGVMGRVPIGNSRWVYSVWIDPNNANRVLAINNPNFVPPAGTGEVDVMRLRKGQTLLVGDSFNEGIVDDAFEIKTPDSPTVRAAQRLFYARIFPTKPVLVVQTRMHLEFPSGTTNPGVIRPNRRVLNQFRLLGAAGAAVGVVALADLAEQTVGCLIAMEDGTAEAKLDEIENAVFRYRTCTSGDIFCRRDNLLSIEAATREFLHLVIPERLVATIASEVFFRALIDDRWE